VKLITENTIHALSDSSVVTIGNFDGVHTGHQALISRCHELAEPGQDVAVICFEPLPQAFFRPAHAPGRLSTISQKIQLFEQSGVDLVWMMRFNQELAELSPEKFARQVISEGVSATQVVVGTDFRFGHARQGDLEMLLQFGQQLGFHVEAVADVEIDGERVSSTVVREALAIGDLVKAEKFLGRPFTMSGEVIEGQGLGRGLGFPTANMKLEAEPCPVAGVFAVKARLEDESAWLDAVASLGNRPAVGGKEFLVEVHLFDFSADIYGQRLEVEFVAKIRDEENFDSIDALVDQMKLDEAQARKILGG
jgi:riboflavin kinase/FMN adenylyltransferase